MNVDLHSIVCTVDAQAPEICLPAAGTASLHSLWARDLSCSWRSFSVSMSEFVLQVLDSVPQELKDPGRPVCLQSKHTLCRGLPFGPAGVIGVLQAVHAIPTAYDRFQHLPKAYLGF